MNYIELMKYILGLFIGVSLGILLGLSIMFRYGDVGPRPNCPTVLLKLYNLVNKGKT